MCCIHSSCLVCCIILLFCHNSYVRRVIQYRCGMIPSLHSDYFYKYRKSVDLVRLCTCYDCMFMHSLLKFNFTSLFNAGLYKCGECPLRHVWCCSLVLLLGWAHNHALCVAGNARIYGTCAAKTMTIFPILFSFANHYHHSVRL